MRTKRGAPAWLAVAVLACAAEVAAARDWLEARIDDFVLVTDAREGYARATLRDFAVFKFGLGVLAPLTRGTPRMPTQMYALDAAEWRSFAPAPHIAGFFLPQTHANFIVFDRTPAGLKSREVVFHEYMHFMLQAGSDLILPAWWDEGVAEVFSSLRERGGRIEFGLVPAARKMDFAYFELMPTSMLFAVDRDSPAYRRHGIAPMFYAQSWLSAHYMLIGNPARGKQMPVYLREINAGTPIAEAVQKAFGVSLDTLDAEIRAYRQKGRIGGFRLSFDKPLPDAKDVVIRPLPEPVALARLAIAGLDVGRNPDDAEKRATRALALDPALPLAQAAMAFVRLRQDRDAEALDWTRKALGAAAGPEATVAAVRAQSRLVTRALLPRKPKAGDDATVEELIDEAFAVQDEPAKPSAAQVAMLQAARAAVLPYASDPDQGLGATLSVTAIDALLADRDPGTTLALVQQATALYPTHTDLAAQEARLCAQLGRYTAAVASASRAARYARSPAYRRALERWAAELAAAADASR
ncbi:MAG: hypothetical protein AB7G76_00510 [Steroidobacteraceae bacterium]